MIESLYEMVLLLLLAIIVGLFLIHTIWTSTYWRRKYIAGPNGLPIFGNMMDFVLARKAYGFVYEEVYNAYPEAAYVGFYRVCNEPAVLVRDLDVVKDIMVKSFSHFQDNILNINFLRDPLIAYNPFAAKSDRWKMLRSQLVPVFTPSKVKNSVAHIASACQKMTSYIEENIRMNCFEAKDLCSKYTLEVVASAAYGLEAEAFTNEKSDFTQLVEDLFQPQKYSLIQTISLLFLPWLGNLIKYQYVPQTIQDWLLSIIGQVLRQRRSENAKPDKQDFLQSMLEAKEKFEDLALVGHCTTMLLEGFETSATLMAFALYEFASNVEIQKKVQGEIDNVLIKYEGQLTFEALQEMSYLECAMLETLRLHPAMMALQKRCTKRYTLPKQFKNKTDPKASIEPGMAVVIPVSAIHYDPQIYPNPREFQPDRFNEENQANRHNFAYLAFGEGPRMCLGMRFGLAQSKAALATILSKYSVRLSNKMKVPVEISPTTFLLASKCGIWVDFVKRDIK